MKTFAITLLGLLLVAGLALAQNSSDVKARNHKLNKNYAKTIKAEGQTVPAKSHVSDNVYSVKARNHKVHKAKRETALVMRKDKVNYDYRSRNHKLSK